MIRGSVKPGDMFRGLVNGAIFKVLSVDTDEGVVTLERNGLRMAANLNSFKRSEISRIKE